MNREIVVVRCMRRHQVGSVTADADGLIVNYVGEVWHREDGTTGIFGASSRVRLTDDESIDFQAYCSVCRKSVRLNTANLRAAALDGKPGVSAPFSDTIDREWTAGRLYPRGLKRFRHDPRKGDTD
jgi:hypothetical protein